MAAPETYQDAAKAAELAKRYQQVQQEVARRYEVWEAAEAALRGGVMAMANPAGNPALFFDGAPEGFALYAALEPAHPGRHPQVTVKVQKTQITFSARFGFAWFWLPDRRVKGCPEAKLMVSFGLDHRVESPRIFAAVEPYPNRWTHHVPVATPAELDGELLDWLEQAYAFGQRPGRKQR